MSWSAVIWPPALRAGPPRRRWPAAVAVSLLVHAALYLAVELHPGRSFGRIGEDDAVAVDLTVSPFVIGGGARDEGASGEQERAVERAGSAQVAASAAPGRGEGKLGRGDGAAAQAPVSGTARLDLGDLLGMGAPELATAGAGGGAADAYRRLLERHIRAYRSYPAQAARRRSEGVVVVRFRIGRSGQVEEAWVVRRSADPALDDAALDTVWRAEPLPPVPAELSAPAEVELPVPFRLQGS